MDVKVQCLQHDINAVLKIVCTHYTIHTSYDTMCMHIIYGDGNSTYHRLAEVDYYCESNIFTRYVPIGR